MSTWPHIVGDAVVFRSEHPKADGCVFRVLRVAPVTGDYLLTHACPEHCGRRDWTQMAAAYAPDVIPAPAHVRVRSTTDCIREGVTT